MSTIILKTANRKTVVSRSKIRRAVEAIYALKDPLPVSKVTPVVSIRVNNGSPKKAAGL